jgi:hypothetical protein
MSSLVKSWRWDLPVLVAVAAYAGVTILLSRMVGFQLPPPSAYLGVASSLGLATVILVGLTLLYDLARTRPESPIAYLRPWLAERRVVERLVLAAPQALALSVLAATFGAMKSSIPLFHPYALDPLFAEMDAALFLGHDPWRVIQPLVGYPWISAGLNLLYNVWLPALLVVSLVFMCWSERPQLRLQYLLAHTLSWILVGSVAATALSSVGPCFYAHYYGDPRFEPLMGYLRDASQTAPIPALKVQGMLLAWAESGSFGLGGGISAMPSMHVSGATLLLLAGRSVSPLWGRIAAVFLAAIFIGSIHLGYHYALDGVAGVLLTVAIWFACGKFASAYLDRTKAAPATVAA